MKVALIPCTNQKADKPGPAREVWTGSHFQFTLLHAETFYDKVYIMSYKYGFITPDTVIEPYDLNIQNRPAVERLQWWWIIKEDIARVVKEDNPTLFAIYTGNYERERIIRELFVNGVRNIIVPWEGLGIGERMQAVYDKVIPFSEEALAEGKYTLPEDFLEKPQELPAKEDSDLEWEEA